MTLDVRTIVVMLVLSSVLMTITLAIGMRTSGARGFAKWNLGLGLYAFGWLLVAARGTLPDIVAMAAADALLLAGLCLQFAAVIEFGNRNAPAWLLYAPGPMLFVATLPVLHDYAVFTLIVSLAYAAAFGAISARALGLGDRAGAARWMLALPYGAAAIGLIARALAMLADSAAYPGLFVQSTVHTVSFLGLFAVTCCGSIAFLLMHRERAEAELYRLATFDQLTGLFNRAAFIELAERELARARRTGRPLAVLMLDLDFFKKVNDEYGHQAGDRVLAEFSAIVRRSVRTEDLVGRYGGEEFCAVLPDADLGKAVDTANRIREAVCARPLAGLPHPVTVSIGAVVCDPGISFTLDAAIARADEALYRAKKGGRNRVTGLEFNAPPTAQGFDAGQTGRLRAA